MSDFSLVRIQCRHVGAGVLEVGGPRLAHWALLTIGVLKKYLVICGFCTG